MPKQITPTKTNKAAPTASTTTATTTITAASPAIGKMLSVAQLLVLSTAAQRADHMLLPLPSTLRLRGGGQTKLLAALAVLTFRSVRYERCDGRPGTWNGSQHHPDAGTPREGSPHPPDFPQAWKFG